MNTLTAAHFRNILLIKPSSLGDCLHALPVLNALRKALPQAEILWLINKQYADLFRSHPAIDELIIFNRDCFRPGHADVSFVKETVKLWVKLRNRRFDLVIDLQGLLRSALMSLATGARVRLGLSDAREWAGVFYTHQIRLQPTDVHAVDRYMRCLDMLSIASETRDFSLPIEPSARGQVDRMLSRTTLNSSEPFVLIVPGARWHSKRWKPERFAQLIDAIQHQLSLPCLLSGTPSELDLCQNITARCKSKPINLAGQTTLVQLAALMSRSKLVLGHDSGTIHLAVALKKPLVCIIGPTDPNCTGPYGRSDSIVKANVDCAPCRRNLCPDNKCMALISVESVFDKLRPLCDS